MTPAILAVEAGIALFVLAIGLRATLAALQNEEPDTRTEGEKWVDNQW